MALQKKFITVFACVLSASAFFACSESKLDGSPTGTVDANASSSSTSDVGTCNVSNINDIKFVAAENMYYRCDGLTWVQQSSSSVASSSSNTSGVNVFATLEDFPNCTASRENQLAVVSTTNTPYMCTEGRWVVYGTSSISSSSSNVASSSSGTKQSSSSVIVSSSSSTPTLSSSSTPIEDPSSSSAECGDEDKVWKAEGGKYYECIDGEWVEGSSSSVESSSSIKDGSEYNASANTLTDFRDGQVYKTVTIGTQIWMAENLNYAYTGVKYNYNSYTSDSTSWCYENKASNCDKYGRLYTWSAVMDSAAQFNVNAGTRCGYGKTCTPNSPHRGICPEGWHVPTNEEYSTLYTYIGDSYTAGSLLKSTSGWNDYNGKSGNGTDKYGFSVLPAGNRGFTGNFYVEGYYAHLWYASEGDVNGNSAWYQSFDYRYGHAGQGHDSKYYGQSLRCLKDSPDQGGEISSSSIDASSSSSSTPTEDLSSSSSSVIASSSGTKQSSSSVAGKPAWQYLNPDIDYGEFTDTRDGQVYKTVTIGTQTWMAENLNYGDVVSWCGGGSVSMEGDCSKYGRLYTWEVAMNDVSCAYGNSCNPSGTVQGVCPTGWHLPTKEEWQKLVKPMATSVLDDTYYDGAGIELKTVDDWFSSSNKGTNASGFSALPAGYRFNYGEFVGAGYSAIFWSASEYDIICAYYLNLGYRLDEVRLYDDKKSHAFSVRCIQN